MREIKFRAWNGIEMIRPSFDGHGKVTSGYILNHYSNVMQYTGLKDKNGVDIYEGDWLRGIQREQKDTAGIYAFPLNDCVSFRGGGFRVFGKCLQDGYTRENNVLYQFMWFDPGHNNIRDSYHQIDEIEIIGNIHENPELLK